MSYPRLVQEVIEELSKMPGVGRRSAERIALWILNNSNDSFKLSDSIKRLKQGLRFCQKCNHLSEDETCLICQDVRRDRSVICVVENPKDLIAIEKTGIYQGLYHVLLGAISPSEGRGPEDLKIEQLEARIKSGGVKEVIIATDPDTEGEMTAIHLTNCLRSLDVRVTRIGFGIPVGSSVEYVDMSTLSISMNSRREITE